MSNQEKSEAGTGPETTSIQIVADVLSTAAHHKLTEGEQTAVASLPPAPPCCWRPTGG